LRSRDSESIYAEACDGEIMRNPPGEINELALIDSIKAASGHRSMGRVQVGIGDDCAVIRPPAGHEIVVTTDFCLEGRHFRRDWHTPESAGHRCLARGLSDLAAMGAKPVAAFLSLALPRGTDRSWVDGFFRGLRALADAVDVPLAGGDTAASPGEHILADIVLVGSVPAGKALLRSTATAGDLIYVTGHLGGSAADLKELANAPGEIRKSGEHPQLFPAPRLAVGQALLRRKLATSCIDVSDGLSSDLKHLCDASHLSAELMLTALPIHPLASGSLDLALNGGEDYELLFSAKPTTRIPASIGGVRITRIGTFTARKPRAAITTIDESGKRRKLAVGGWEHRFG
jgi:thiamine-monophosphate kinase